MGLRGQGCDWPGISGLVTGSSGIPRHFARFKFTALGDFILLFRSAAAQESQWFSILKR